MQRATPLGPGLSVGQLGLLDPTRLPVTGAEAADRVIDEQLPLNTLPAEQWWKKAMGEEARAILVETSVIFVKLSTNPAHGTATATTKTSQISAFRVRFAGAAALINPDHTRRDDIDF